jgi:hypothetical protein
MLGAMNQTSPSPPKRTVGWWAFGFGLLTLLAAFFVPVVGDGLIILGYSPLKLVVFALAATTAVLVAIAYINREDRRLYAMALGAAFVGVFFEYLVVALVVAVIIVVVFSALG